MRGSKTLLTLSLALLWPLAVRSAGSSRDTNVPPGRVFTAAPQAPARPEWLRVAERYGLVPTFTSGPVSFRSRVAGGRALHELGDPDTLFTLLRVNAGPARVSGAIEVNDVIPRVLAPDPEVDESSAHSRAQGRYNPLDAYGCPRQVRVSARVAW